MSKIIGLSILILMLPALALGSHCAVRTVQVQYAAPVYSVPTYPVIPLYTVGHQQDLGPLLQKMEALIQSQALMIQALKSGGTLALKAEPPGLGAMRATCARCHNETTKKGGLTLFAGGAFVGHEHLERISYQMKERKMPPPEAKQPTGEERALIYEFLFIGPARPAEALAAPAPKTEPK